MNDSDKTFMTDDSMRHYYPAELTRSYERPTFQNHQLSYARTTFVMPINSFISSRVWHIHGTYASIL